MPKRSTLMGSPKDVVVVPAAGAWDEYLDFGAYICQPGRSFRPVDYLAFYKNNEILDKVPRVLEVRDQVDYVKGKHRGRLRDVIEGMINSGVKRKEPRQKVFLLTGPDDPRTQRLSRPIPNNVHAGNGRRIAFARGHRYASLDDLLRATSTTDLNR